MAFKRYRKKPVLIDAIRYTGDFGVIDDWVEQWLPRDAEQGQGMWESSDGKALIIDTNEGEMRAEIGDFIIREPFATEDRMFYPCKPDIFEQTYDEVVCD